VTSLIILIIIERLIGKNNQDISYFDLVICFIIGFLIVLSNLPIILNLILITSLTLLKKVDITKRKFGKEDSLLIKNGRFLVLNMLKLGVSFPDLKENLKDKELKDIKRAYFLNNELIINYQENNLYPLALITNGKIDYENLDLINKDKLWLEANLDLDIEDVYYGFYNNEKIYVIKKDLVN